MKDIAAKLSRFQLPKINLPSTAGGETDLNALKGKSVIFIYPMLNPPDTIMPKRWDETPGASGCTAQTCGYRDLHADFEKNGITVYGLSNQSIEKQVANKARLNLQYELLADENMQLEKHLELPVFELEEGKWYSRITLVLQDNIVMKVFYPIEDPRNNVNEVLNWFGI